MKTKNMYITIEDMKHLTAFLSNASTRYEKDNAHLAALRKELDRAVAVLPERMPPDIVTIHSHVLLRDLDSGEGMEYVVVFPEFVNVIAGRISVVSPIGAAILGRKVGSTVQVTVPAGVRRIRIERILYQPEMAMTTLLPVA